MANELEMPAHLYRTLNERLRNSNKQGEIELYYELLSAGHSVGEILNGVDPVQSKSEHGYAAIAEYPQSGPDVTKPDKTAIEFTSEAALAEVAQTNARDTRGLTITRDTEKCGPEKSQATSGDQEQPRSGKSPGTAKRIAFGAVYTVMVASASIAGFSIVRSGRDAVPAITRVQANIANGGGSEAVARPASAADRSEAIVEAPQLAERLFSADTSHAPEPSQPGEPDSRSSQPIATGPGGSSGNGCCFRARGELRQRPDAGQMKPVEELRVSAAAPSDPAHDFIPSIAQSIFVTPPAANPLGPVNAGPHSNTGQPEPSETLHAAPRDKAKATATVPTKPVPSKAVSAALPSRAHATRRSNASTPRPDVEPRRYVRRRTPAKYLQSAYGGQSPGPQDRNRGAGLSYADPARGYGYGGPAPYSEMGN